MSQKQKITQNLKKLAEKIIGDKNELNSINVLLQQFIKEEEISIEGESALGYLRKVFKILLIGKKMVQFNENYESFDLDQAQNKDDEQIGNFISEKLQGFVQLLIQKTFSRHLQEEFRVICLRTLIELSRYHYKNSQQNVIVENNVKVNKSEIIIKQICEQLLTKYAENNCGEITIVLYEYSAKYHDFCAMYLNTLNNILKKIKAQLSAQGQDEAQKLIVIENITSVIQDFPNIDKSEYQITNLFYQELSKNSGKLIHQKNLNNIPKSKELQLLLKKRKNPNSMTEEDRKKQTDKDQYITLILDLQELFSQFVFTTIQLIGSSEEGQVVFTNSVVENILNNMSNPLLISDYLIKVFDNAQDCNLQVVSLSSVLVLIGKFGLEYPQFYHKMYKLIGNPQIFKCDERSKFMNMVEQILKGSSVTMTVQASFIKKFLRIALQQPPNVILWVLSIIINTLKRNPTLCKMIDSKDVKTGIKDSFQPQETDIFNTQAEQSYLWEIKSLKNHYLNEVNKLISVMGSDLQVANFLETQPFSDLIYADLINLALQTAEEKKQSFMVSENVAQSNKVELFNNQYFQ